MVHVVGLGCPTLMKGWLLASLPPKALEVLGSAWLLALIKPME